LKTDGVLLMSWAAAVRDRLLLLVNMDIRQVTSPSHFSFLFSSFVIGFVLFWGWHRSDVVLQLTPLLFTLCVNLFQDDGNMMNGPTTSIAHRRHSWLDAKHCRLPYRGSFYCILLFWMTHIICLMKWLKEREMHENFITHWLKRC
jgi:hypothetical protein